MKEIEKLKVYSEKLHKYIELTPMLSGGFDSLAVKAMWSDSGWSNSSWNWLNNGWNNNSGSWMNNGWNNNSGSWKNNGWSNSSGSWSNNGWNNSSDKGGCFLTTACINYKGLKDDCEELNTLRIFRDKLVEEDENFREVVLEYYRTAPEIVSKILESEEKDIELEALYNSLVIPCVNLLKEEKTEEAKEYYISYYKKLSKKYLDK